MTAHTDTTQVFGYDCIVYNKYIINVYSQVKKLMKRADLLMDSGEYTKAKTYKAMEQYKQCISLLDVNIPGNFSIHSELLSKIAWCYFCLDGGQYNSCIQSCDQSLAINPCNLFSIWLRAFAYSMKKDPASVRTAYEGFALATLVEPSDKQAQEELARTAKALRSLHGEHWRQYVKPKPSIPKGPVFVPAPASQSPSSSHSSGTLASQSVDSVTKDPASLLLDNTIGLSDTNNFGEIFGLLRLLY